MIVPYVRVIAAPSCEPASLDQAKAWCRVDHSNDDALISLLLKAVRERFEEITGRACVRRQLELRLDSFPPWPPRGRSSFPFFTSQCPQDLVIELPFPPLRSVDYVSYLDASGTLQTMSGSPSSWIEDTGSEPGRIQPLSGATWPATLNAIAAVRIGFTCGYAPVGSPEDDAALQAGIPALAKTWMQARLATFYDKRDQIVIGDRLEQVPRDFVDGLLDGLRINKNFA